MPFKRELARVSAKSWELTSTQRWASRRLRARFAESFDSSRTGYQVLIAPPGNGNIGDQAMVEAFLENTDGPVVVVQRRDGDITVPESVGSRASLVSMPDLIFGRGAARAADLDRFRELLAGACAVAIVGADMVDGGYSRIGSVQRVLLGEVSVLAGVPTRILGFSWSGTARPVSLRALRDAARAGVVPVVRDPDSAARLRAGGVQGVVDGSDIVFSATTTSVPGVDGLDLGQPYAVLNVSALVGRKVTPAAYVPIVEHLRTRGLQVVLLPHVLRGTSNDLTACAALRALVEGELPIVDRQLRPEEVRGLASGARVTITGRMHLAIMSMSSGVPAITFSTQGKVSGLMRLLGVDELCVEPEQEMAPSVVRLIDEVLDDDRLRRAVAEHLPNVKRLSAENFATAPAALTDAS